MASPPSSGSQASREGGRKGRKEGRKEGSGRESNRYTRLDDRPTGVCVAFVAVMHRSLGHRNRPSGEKELSTAEAAASTSAIKNQSYEAREQASAVLTPPRSLPAPDSPLLRRRRPVPRRKSERASAARGDLPSLTRSHQVKSSWQQSSQSGAIDSRSASSRRSLARSTPLPHLTHAFLFLFPLADGLFSSAVRPTAGWMNCYSGNEKAAAATTKDKAGGSTGKRSEE